MANFRRKKPRHRTSIHKSSRYYEQRIKDKNLAKWIWMGHWPKSYDVVYHTRPQRRRQKELVSRVLKGTLDPDNATFCIQYKKPHQYYW